MIDNDLWQYVLCGMSAGILLKLTVELLFYVVNSLLGIFKNI